MSRQSTMVVASTKYPPQRMHVMKGLKFVRSRGCFLPYAEDWLSSSSFKLALLLLSIVLLTVSLGDTVDDAVFSETATLAAFFARPDLAGSAGTSLAAFTEEKVRRIVYWYVTVNCLCFTRLILDSSFQATTVLLLGIRWERKTGRSGHGLY